VVARLEVTGHGSWSLFAGDKFRNLRQKDGVGLQGFTRNKLPNKGRMI
jgi:hypothetical protein